MLTQQLCLGTRGASMERHEKIQTIVQKFFQESADTNPYASAEKVRALDQIVRNTMADHLATAAGIWRRAYQMHMQAMGHPTRDHPLPSASDLARGTNLRRMAEELSVMATTVLALEAPASDRVYHRVRDNDGLLDALVDMDYAAITLGQRLTAISPDAPDAITQMTDAMQTVQTWLVQRRTVFTV